MPQTPPAAVALSACRSPWLRGSVRVPGDRDLTRLALLLAALARGPSRIEHGNAGADVAALLAALRLLGVTVTQKGIDFDVIGMGVGGFLAPEEPIDLAHLGDGALLLIALLGAHDFETRFSGYTPTAMSESLIDFLHRTGARVERKGSELILQAPRFPLPLDLNLPREALALKAPLMLAALVTTGTSIIRTPDGSDPSDGLAMTFGAGLTAAPTEDGTRVSIEGMTPLAGQTFVVPGDPVFAAFPAAAALIAPDSEIAIETLSVAPSRMVLLDALKLLGGDLSLGPAKAGGRDTADLLVQAAKLSGATIPATLPIEPEDFPILAVVASVAKGETLFEGLGEGQARLNLTRALRANGVDCEERPGGLLVRGMAKVPGGGKVATKLDPKLAMAFLVLGLGSDKPITIDDGAAMADIFPGFTQAFEHIGGRFVTGEGK